MSVDYTANFGIGYKIKKVSEDKLEKYGGDFSEYLTDLLKNFVKGVTYFETGWSRYESSNESEEWFLTVEEPFVDGLDLTHIKACLDDIIDSTDLERDSDFGVVGGLLVW